MKYGFGVDIFGTNIKIACFREDGTLIAKWRLPVSAQTDGSAILPVIAEELEEYMHRNRIFEDDVIGVGVGVPGPVNGSGVVNKCVNLGWGVFNVDRALSGLTGLRVKSGNIANLSAMGECWKGSGSANTVFLAFNIGLGGAVVCDGRVVHGAHGGGGELGHMTVNRQEKEVCTCGRRGCVEQYCSPTGILRLASRALAASRMPSALRKRPPKDYKDVLKAAAAGDKLAQEVMDQVHAYVGQLLANVCCVTNPDTIVLGGDFPEMGQSTLTSIASHFYKNVFHANREVSFKMATLDKDACVYGAFKLVLDTYGQE